MVSTSTTYIETDSGYLFAALDRPAPGEAIRIPLLMIAPWGWAETASYRGRRQWGRRLADAGHPVLRFDLPAVGDSSGSPGDPGLHGAWVDAIVVASRWLSANFRQFPAVSALGLGIGGLLALEGVSAGAPIDQVALWAAPATGSAFVRETRMFSRMQAWDGSESGGSPVPDGWIEASGFVLAAETAESLRALDPTALEVPQSLRRALLLGREGVEPSAELREHLEGAGVAVSSGPGPGWEEMIAHPAFSEASEEVEKALEGWMADGGPEGGRLLAVAPDSAGQEAVEFKWNGEPVRESLFSFPIDGGAGRGVVAEPAARPARAICGVFFNAGAVRHIGPNRLWVDAARNLAARGIPSARLDFEGLGESDGVNRFANEADYFADGQMAQISSMLDQLEARGLGNRFVVVGLCSGGYWAFRSALEDPRVIGALPLNPAAFRWRSTLMMERHGHGISLLLRRDLWARLARGEVGVKRLRALARLLVDRVKSAVATRLAGLRGGATPAGDGQRPRDVDLEAEFDLLQSAGKRVTIGFTEDEVLLREASGYSTFDELDRWPDVRLVDLPGVDHVLAPTSAQRFAGDLIAEEFDRLAGPDDAAIAPRQASGGAGR